MASPLDPSPTTDRQRRWGIECGGRRSLLSLSLFLLCRGYLFSARVDDNTTVRAPPIEVTPDSIRGSRARSGESPGAVVSSLSALPLRGVYGSKLYILDWVGDRDTVQYSTMTEGPRTVRSVL
jgi:hypothetical protein